MQVRIDRRTENLGRFKPGVEVEAQFPCHVEIGTLAGGDHDAVERAKLHGLRSFPAADDDGAVGLANAVGGKAGDQLQSLVIRKRLEVAAKLSAGGQPVGSAAAENPRQVIAAQRPGQFHQAAGLREPCEIEQHVCRRMSATDHQHAFAGIERRGRLRAHRECRRR